MDESTRASAPTAIHFDARYIERAQLPDGTASRCAGSLRRTRLCSAAASNGSHPSRAASAVIDAWQGRGLGRLLLARLVAAARERGVTTFRVSLLADNTAVRALIDHAGEATRLAGGSGAIVVDVPLPDVPPLESSLPRTSALYRLFRGAARGVVAAFGSRRT